MLAITGGTGFVGRRLLGLAAPPWRALTRRPQSGHHWVGGTLDDTAALARLCAGADAVIHIAGVVNAADRTGFEAGNITGTANILAAAHAAGVRRFVHVSSLAAREPALSNYGWSKAGADALVQASPLDWVIVRPPAVYGPGDTEMLPLLKLARAGWGLAPGGADARLSLIHVDDLARALLLLARQGPSGAVLELDDGQGARGGYSHREFATLAAQAQGRLRVRMVAVPSPLLSGASLMASLLGRLTGQQPKLSRDRARYLAHPDWVARGGNAQLAGLWTPQIDAAAGLAETMAQARKTD
jgi:nucleoside-diphosphate-sugar epimerase